MARAPKYTLYSPTAVLVHTLLFSPLVGGFMVSRNHQRRGDAKRAQRALLAGFAATVALALIATLLERWLGNAVQGGVAGGTGAMAMTWYREQKPLFDEHRRAGGAAASIVAPALGGLALIAVVLGLLFASFSLDASGKSFDAGARAMHEGRHAEAAKLFRDVLAEEPDSAEARFNLALALYCIDANDDATAELGRIPSDAAIYPRAHALYQRAQSAKVLGWALMKDHCQ